MAKEGVSNLEKAQIMFKLARKANWNASYDRTEHFKRFPNLDKAIRELLKTGWIIIHKKSNYACLSLNTEFKREVIEFIKKEIPEVGGMVG